MGTQAAPDGDPGAGDAHGAGEIDGRAASGEGALSWAVLVGGQGQFHNKCFVLALRASSPMVGIHVPARSWGWGRVIAPFSSQQCHTTGCVLWGH